MTTRVSANFGDAIHHRTSRRKPRGRLLATRLLGPAPLAQIGNRPVIIDTAVATIPANTLSAATSSGLASDSHGSTWALVITIRINARPGERGSGHFWSSSHGLHLFVDGHRAALAGLKLHQPPGERALEIRGIGAPVQIVSVHLYESIKSCIELPRLTRTYNSRRRSWFDSHVQRLGADGRDRLSGLRCATRHRRHRRGGL